MKTMTITTTASVATPLIASACTHASTAAPLHVTTPAGASLRGTNVSVAVRTRGLGWRSIDGLMPVVVAPKQFGTTGDVRPMTDATYAFGREARTWSPPV